MGKTSLDSIFYGTQTPEFSVHRLVTTRYQTLKPCLVTGPSMIPRSNTGSSLFCGFHSFFTTLYPFCNLQINLVHIKKVLKCATWFPFLHGISGLAIAINPFHFCNFSAFVRLA